MDIAHSQYHKHGGYLLDNMDLSGFSRPEQHNLSMIVRSHRRKFPIEELDGSPGLIALCVLLRLAVVLHRGRAENTLPAFWVAPAGDGEIRITFPRKWLAEHPLTKLPPGTGIRLPLGHSAEARRRRRVGAVGAGARRRVRACARARAVWRRCPVPQSSPVWRQRVKSSNNSSWAQWRSSPDAAGL